MTNSKRSSRKLTRAERVAKYGEDAVRESEREVEIINEAIQNRLKIEKWYSDEIDKLPSMFQIAKRFRKSYKGLVSVESNAFKGIFDEMRKGFDELETDYLPFEILIFESIKLKKSEKGKTKKLSFLRQTKRNLRYVLKDQMKIIKTDFSSMGSIEPSTGKLFAFSANSSDPNYLPFGQATTSQIYSNPIIQSFFEFSLRYSYTKHIELSFEKARKIFIKACKISLNLSVKQANEAEAFSEFLDFLYQRGGVFSNLHLPTYETGRPSKPEDTAEQIIELAKQGKSNLEISKTLEPNLRGKNRTIHIANVGRTARRYGFHARNRKINTTKN